MAESHQCPTLRCLPAGARHGPHLPPAAGAGAGALFRQTYHRDDPALEYLTLGFLDALLRRVPVYRLTCGMTDDAVRCSFEALTGLPYENYRRPDGCGEEGSAL